MEAVLSATIQILFCLLTFKHKYRPEKRHKIHGKSPSKWTSSPKVCFMLIFYWNKQWNRKVVKYLVFDGFAFLHWPWFENCYFRISKNNYGYHLLKCGFCKKSFIMNAPLVSSWAYLLGGFAVAPTQKWWQICSTD